MIYYIKYCEIGQTFAVFSSDIELSRSLLLIMIPLNIEDRELEVQDGLEYLMHTYPKSVLEV